MQDVRLYPIMLYIALIPVVPLLLFLWLRRGNDKGKRVEDGDVSKVIQGPNALPLIGNIHSLDKECVQKTFYDWMLAYGPVYRFFLFREEFVVISDPKVMHAAFSELNTRPEMLPGDLNFNNSGVALSDYEGNRTLVKEITWELYRDTFQDPYIEKLQDKNLDEFIDDLIGQSEGVLDVDKAVLKSIASHFSVEIIGQKPSSEIIEASLAYYNAINELFTKGRPVILTMFPWIRNVPGSLKRIVNTYITSTGHAAKVMNEEARKTYKKGEEHGMLQKFFSRQEEENTRAGSELPQITDENVYASVIIDVLAGGLAGTSGAISVCFMYLLQYPEVLKKVNKEMSEIRLRKKVNDIVQSDMPYLYACIMECIRLGSTIHITFPRHVDNDITIAGYRFKKNQTVFVSVWNIHHSEEFWEDPFNLRPERFLDESGQLVPTTHPLRQAFVPFGAGPRYCKGNRTAMDKVFKYVSRTLYRCHIQTVADKPMPSGDPRAFKSLVATIVPEFACKFSERK